MTTEEIRKAAAVVRDEETANANTATRVGGVLVDLCDAIDVASGEAAAANGATNQVVAAHTQYIDVLKPWLRGSLGHFATSEAFNIYLDGLSYDTLKNGRYVAYLGGVPFFVTFSLLYAKDQISAIWVEGSLMVSGNVISSNTGKGVTICYRYYKNGAWGTWKTIYDELNGAVTSQGSRISTLEGKMPSVQTSANGTTKNYIYSASGDDMHTALSSKVWMYTHTDGNLFLRFKHWGANNDTNQSNYSQVMLSNAWVGGNGVLRRDVYSRLDSFSLREENSTADAVKIVTPIFTTGGTRSFTIGKATTAKAGVMNVEDKIYIETLKPWLWGSLGNFDSSEAFNKYLNGLSYDTLKSGRYIVYLGGVPFFVTFSVLYAKEQISAIWVEGSLMVTDNVISSNTGKGVTICYRYYKNGAWEAWKTIYDDLNGAVASQGSRISTLEGKMPSVQTSANGTTKNFIYSASGDEMHTALSGKIWMHPHTDGNLFLRFKHWGANDDTNESNYSQVMICHKVSNNQDGLMDKFVYARILNHNLTEGQSTTDKVIVNYTNFAKSGNKQLEITKATTAKAGVMTAAQVTALNKASEDIKALKERIVALEKKVAALEAK